MAESDSRKKSLFELIDQLELKDEQKSVLRGRWADQTSWYGSKARDAKKKRNRFRVIVIFGGALLPAVPAITSLLQIGDFSEEITAVIALVGAITAGLDAFFDYHDDYNRYRENAELLKSEGWSYFSLSGTYKHYKSHGAAFERFCERVEDVIRRELKAFVEDNKEDANQGQ